MPVTFTNQSDAIMEASGDIANYLKKLSNLNKKKLLEAYKIIL
jgi:hypothetical protein